MNLSNPRPTVWSGSRRWTSSASTSERFILCLMPRRPSASEDRAWSEVRPRRSDLRQAAVDRQLGPGDETALVAGEEQRGRGHFIDARQAA